MTETKSSTHFNFSRFQIEFYHTKNFVQSFVKYILKLNAFIEYLFIKNLYICLA